MDGAQNEGGSFGEREGAFVVDRWPVARLTDRDGPCGHLLQNSTSARHLGKEMMAYRSAVLEGFYRHIPVLATGLDVVAPYDCKATQEDGRGSRPAPG